MSESPSPRPRTPERVEQFIIDFFGPGNSVWPALDPDSDAGRNLVPFLQALRESTEVPVVLPRRRPDSEHRLTAYVIALDAAHATAVAELLTAFVGPSYSTFDGLPAELDPGDKIENAVLSFAGPGATFTVSSPTSTTQARAWTALRQLQEAVKLRPIRAWHAPKPVGRLIAEFDVALAAGDNAASSDILGHLAVSGGLSAVNVAHLRLKRLARLGRDGELLRMPGLADIVAADPPGPVKEAILAAIYTNFLATALEDGNLAAARRLLIEAGGLVPALLRCDIARLSPEALSVIALAALIRQDHTLLEELTSLPSAVDRIRQAAPALADAITVTPGPDGTGGNAIAPPDDEQAQPSSWVGLIAAAVECPSIAESALSREAWREWTPPAHEDEALAAALGDLDDVAAEHAWTVVGPFIDVDGYQQPAALSARELINNALAYSRFSPGDLAGLVALTEITLRSALGAAEYAGLLDDLRAECGRWASPDRAVAVLDLTDLLARAACPDNEPRLRLAISLLRPLADHHLRLDPDQLSLARQLSVELETGLTWPEVAEGVPLPITPGTELNVLLYSLDEGVLRRVSAILSVIAPALKVQLSHDHVGSPRLRQRSRQADVIVLATRCATHAATGFIRSNATASALVREADGSGSASLLRAVSAALQTRQAREVS
jgi:hypothetical protein